MLMKSLALIATGEELDISDPGRTCREVMEEYIGELPEDATALLVCGWSLYAVVSRGRAEYYFFRDNEFLRGRDALSRGGEQQASPALVFLELS